MATHADGVSRRRVLLGTVWTAPAILVATSVPARAASIPVGGVVYIGLSSTFSATHFDETTGLQIPAVTTQANIQNQPLEGGGASPDVIAALLTFSVPVGAIADPAWGLGSNLEGIANPSYTISSGPTVSDGVFTVTFSWTGVGGTWATTQPTLWVQVADDSVVGQAASSTIAATHDNGDSSSDATNTTVV